MPASSSGRAKPKPFRVYEHLQHHEKAYCIPSAIDQQSATSDLGTRLGDDLQVSSGYLDSRLDCGLRLFMQDWM